LIGRWLNGGVKGRRKNGVKVPNQVGTSQGRVQRPERVNKEAGIKRLVENPIKKKRASWRRVFIKAFKQRVEDKHKKNACAGRGVGGKGIRLRCHAGRELKTRKSCGSGRGGRRKGQSGLGGAKNEKILAFARVGGQGQQKRKERPGEAPYEKGLAPGETPQEPRQRTT